MSGANPDSARDEFAVHPDGATTGNVPERPAGGEQEGVGTIAATAFFLLLVPLLLLMIFSGQGKALDPASVWAEVFAEPSPGEDFAFVGASQLPSRERLVIAERVSDDPRLPERLSLVLYASPVRVTDAMEAQGVSQFQDRRGRRGRGGPGGGGGDWGGSGGDDIVTLQHGLVEWETWQARFVHDRAWASPDGEGGSELGDGSEVEGSTESHKPEEQHGAGAPFNKRQGPGQDTIRVNLSGPDHLCILYATWPLGTEAEVDWMGELLGELRYR